MSLFNLGEIFKDFGPLILGWFVAGYLGWILVGQKKVTRESNEDIHELYRDFDFRVP